ncbi:uncharacterized protein RJT20DRAFT_65540 [Scheffersomyces xylosifermentans]|uniref:uncharacterized protein n=1 Tax=Scheffersomyces xylosifermentans TaxID=1304137 RepID=UPI00315C9907
MSNIKKKTIIKTSKSSDRRLAGSRQASSFLHNALAKSDGDKVTRVVGAPSSSGTSSQESGKTVKRTVGGKSWEDSSLLEWDPKHFRLFVGNLGEDANDHLLHGAFSKYGSMSKVKVPVDNKTGKNKGFGFVAFADANDYFQAFKEMNGKYIGQHPVQLKRAETQIKATKSKKRR